MKLIKIKFVDFWQDFDINENFIVDILKHYYDIEFSDSPEYLFFGTFGYQHLRYNCIKIMFVGENITPDFNVCDYALGFDYIDFSDRYFRLPLYQTYPMFSRLQSKVMCEEYLLNRKFCSIVVSNARYSSPHRERFFRLLSEYKEVDSGGRLWNNVGGPVEDKLAFISKYKFNIAFENSSVQGYTTEKIMEPMAVNTMPIYWGNVLVDREFNPNSFINVNNFNSLEEAVQYVVDIDNDDRRYIEMLSQPWITNDVIINWQAHFSRFLINIIEKSLPEAKILSNYGQQNIYRRNLLAANIIFDKLRLPKFLSFIEKLRNR